MRTPTHTVALCLHHPWVQGTRLSFPWTFSTVNLLCRACMIWRHHGLSIVIFFFIISSGAWTRDGGVRGDRGRQEELYGYYSCFLLSCSCCLCAAPPHPLSLYLSPWPCFCSCLDPGFTNNESLDNWHFSPQSSTIMMTWRLNDD